MKKEDFVKADAVYQLGLPPRRIDLLTGITAVTFDEAWPSRRSGRLGHLSVPFLGRDALIKNKRALGRAKDLVDVALLEKQSAP